MPPENFFVHTVQFPNADLTDEELAVLVGCRGLVELSLYQNPKLTPVGLNAIGPLPRLKGLNLEGTQCARGGLAFISDYPALENLQLLDVERADGSAMRTLPPCPHLKVLSTTHNVGEDGLTHIAANCPVLESLILNDQTVSSLAPLAHGQHFNICIALAPNLQMRESRLLRHCLNFSVCGSTHQTRPCGIALGQ